MAEIQGVMQKIKTEYQQGVDYRFTEEVEGYLKKNVGVEHFRILSPRLKKFCRERFDFPPVANIFSLQYEKSGEEGEYFYYHVCSNYGYDTFCLWDKDNMLSQSKERKCLVCGDLTFRKNGWMKWWDGKEKGLDSPDPNVNGYFHPECAKKHFADKEQPKENNTRIKEKLLRNLDKICLDPMGELANAELLKPTGIEKNYNNDNYASLKDKSKPSYDKYEKWIKEAHTVEIEGEKIELGDYTGTSVGSLGYQEVKEALMREIKQNPTEWEIVEHQDKSSWLCDGSSSQPIIKHKSGRRHWKSGFYHFWSGLEKKRKEWDEIEALINGSPLPVNNKKSNNPDLDNLKIIFQKLNIEKITFENGKLTILYKDNQVVVSSETETNNSEYKLLEKYCQKYNKQLITKEQLGLGSNTNSNNHQPNNRQLVIGLITGVIGGIALTGIIIFLLLRKRKNK